LDPAVRKRAYYGVSRYRRLQSKSLQKNSDPRYQVEKVAKMPERRLSWEVARSSTLK